MRPIRVQPIAKNAATSGADRVAAATSRITSAVFSAIEQHRLAGAAGGRVLRARPAIVDHLEHHRLLGRLVFLELLTAQLKDVAPDVTLAVDRARRQDETSST